MGTWQHLADSLSWTQGHQGKGYLLHDGTIKTWNVDTFNPVDHFTVLQQNGETSPSALNFEIDPDGGVVTKEPSTKVQTIVNADSRLYDAGQRPVFEDNWDLQDHEQSPKEEHSPDYNFVNSAVDNMPYHYHPWWGIPCTCGWGQSREQEKTASGYNSEYIRRLKNQNQKVFRDERGQRFLDALDRFATDHPDAEAMAPWLASRYKKGDVTIAPDGSLHYFPYDMDETLRDLQNESKQELDDIPSVTRRHERVKQLKDLALQLAFKKFQQKPWFEKYDSLGRAVMDRSGELRLSPKQLADLAMSEQPHEALQNVGRSYQSLARTIQPWQEWFNARQHPTRHGVDIMQHSPRSVDEMARAHQRAMQEAKKKEYWLESYLDPPEDSWTDESGVPMEPPNVQHVFGPEAGPYKGWQVVKLSPYQAEGDSEALGHCIGDFEDQPYHHNIGTGNIDAYSLRDAEGYPHVSWHINPSRNGIGHLQGRSGEASEDYRNLITQFNQQYALPDEEVSQESLPSRDEEEEEPEYDRYYELPAPETIDELIREENDPWAIAHDDPDANIGEHTELEYNAPYWIGIAEDYLGGGAYDNDRFFRVLRERGQGDEFAYALEQAMDPTNADDRHLVSYWNSEGARNGDEWVDMPGRDADTVDEYNEVSDEGEEPTVNDWDALAYDYLNFPGTQHGDFNNALANNSHDEYMREAIGRNLNWEDEDHQQAMAAWNQYWKQNFPAHVIEPPANPPYQEDPNMPVRDYTVEPPWGQPLWRPQPPDLTVQSSWKWDEPMWHFGDYQGWTNWETWNTKLMVDNEQPTYEMSRAIVRDGGTPQQLEQWLLRQVIGPYNQERIQEAQEWNAIDPDERRRMMDERNREQYGDAAVDLGNSLMEPFGGWDDPGEDDTAEIIDPNEVNWYEIYESIYNELIENNEYAVSQGDQPRQLSPQHPNPMDQPGESTLPEGWTAHISASDWEGLAPMDPIVVPGRGEMSPPRNEQEAIYQAIGEAAQNGDYERVRSLYKLLPENMQPVQEPMASGPNILSPAIELKEWLGDLGGEEPEVPSIHHDTPEDTIIAPQTSASEALPYFPPANIPKEYKQSQTNPYEDNPMYEKPEVIHYDDLRCRACGHKGMNYEHYKKGYLETFWDCPRCGQSPRSIDVPVTGEPQIDKLLYEGAQDRWRPRREPQDEARNDVAPIPEGGGLGGPDNRLAIPPEHQGMDLQCHDCRRHINQNEGYAQDPATGQIYCLTCIERHQHLGHIKFADSPINQADATNDPLMKNPAIIPSRQGDPDYLRAAPCPNCQQIHRPDEPCPDTSVTQFRQQERAWYNRDNNSLHHGPGPGPDGLEDHARISAWYNAPTSSNPELYAMSPRPGNYTDYLEHFRRRWTLPDLLAERPTRPEENGQRGQQSNYYRALCQVIDEMQNEQLAPHQAASWDPLTCEHCGSPMTEPKMVGNKYMNHCTRCGSWREVPVNYPVLQQQRQEEAISPYPDLLRSVGPERAWMTSSAMMWDLPVD